MKKILFVGIAFVSTLSFAQKSTISDINMKGFSGVKVIKESKEVYFSYFDQKTENKGMANYVLYILDADLKQKTKSVFEVNKNADLVANSFNGKEYLFSFRDLWKKTIMHVVLDGAGKQVGLHTVEKVKMSLDNPITHGLSNGDFVIIQPIKEDKVGYRLDVFDHKMVSKLSKTYTPEKGAYECKSSKVLNDKLYLMREVDASFSNKFYTEIVCYDLKTGEIVYNNPLNDETSTGYATFFNVEPDGKLVTGGMYFKGQKFDDKNSDGIFSLIIDPTGKVLSKQKTPWAAIKDKIKSDQSLGALINGKSKVLIEDMVYNQDGSFSIIGENFRKSSAGMTGNLGMALAMGSGSSSSAVGFTIEDLCLFDYSASGQLLNIRKVGKEAQEFEINDLSNPGKDYYKGLQLAMILKRGKLFPYQFQVEYNGEKTLVFFGEEGTKKMAYFMSSSAINTSNLPKIDLQLEDIKVGEGLNNALSALQSVTGNKSTVNIEYGSVKDYAGNSKGVLHFYADKIVMYKMYYADKMLKIDLWQNSMPK